mgnify:CR=1 FL=1
MLAIGFTRLALGVHYISDVVGGYALGLAGYSALHMLTRASYAAADTRTPAVVNAAAGAVA